MLRSALKPYYNASRVGGTQPCVLFATCSYSRAVSIASFSNWTSVVIYAIATGERARERCYVTFRLKAPSNQREPYDREPSCKPRIYFIHSSSRCPLSFCFSWLELESVFATERHEMGLRRATRR